MKRLICINLIILSLFLISCTPKEETYSFDAVIIEINGDSVLVEAVPGDPIRNSSDKISFSKSGLEDIGAELDDTVTVTYEGGVMESYPAQVRATKWTLKEKAMA